jgi:hypothetical protein
MKAIVKLNGCLVDTVETDDIRKITNEMVAKHGEGVYEISLSRDEEDTADEQ